MNQSDLTREAAGGKQEVMGMFTRFDPLLPGIPKAVLQSFDKLPMDEHVKGSFRFRCRRYSHGKFSYGIMRWQLPCEPFVQKREINGYAGDLLRQFEDIDPTVRDWLAQALIPLLCVLLPYRNPPVGIHQIRIVADDEHMGYPAPEGPHHDGFEHVGLVVAGKQNCNGAETLLVNPDNHHEEWFAATLGCGSAVLFNDRACKHYTSPITPRMPRQAATRDIFVATFGAAVCR